MTPPTDYALVCPFLTDSPDYARGVEFGLLWAQLRDPKKKVVMGYYLTENQDQILLAASRLGWAVEDMHVWKGGREWTWFLLRRAK